MLQERHRALISILAATIRNRRESGAAADDGLTPEHAAAVVVATREGLGEATRRVDGQPSPAMT